MLSQVIKLTADATAFQRGVAAAAKQTDKAFKAVTSELTGRLAGAFAVGAIIDRITGFTSAVIENADALDEMSDLLNMSIEDIQRLQTAANLAGVPFKKLKGILDGIAAAKEQALTGDVKKQQLFSALGVNPASASALQILEAAANAKKGTPAAAAAADILGKRMNDVLGVMRALRGLGPVELITSEQAKRIAQAKDDLEEAYRRLKVAATPAITTGLDVGAVTFRGVTRMLKGRGGTLFTSLFGQLASEAIDNIFRADTAALPLPEGKSRKPPPTTTPPTASAIPLTTQGDALSRIGLFVGGAGMTGTEQLVTIGNYQLSELRRIRATLEHANQ